MVAKLEWTQSNAHQNIKTITESHNGSNNQQRINNNRTTALERTTAKATGGLNALHWYQIFALYFPSLKHKKCRARMKNSYLLQCIIIEKQYNQINAL